MLPLRHPTLSLKQKNKVIFDKAREADFVRSNNSQPAILEYAQENILNITEEVIVILLRNSKSIEIPGSLSSSFKKMLSSRGVKLQKEARDQFIFLSFILTIPITPSVFKVAAIRGEINTKIQQLLDIVLFYLILLRSGAIREEVSEDIKSLIPDYGNVLAWAEVLIDIALAQQIANDFSYPQIKIQKLRKALALEMESLLALKQAKDVISVLKDEKICSTAKMSSVQGNGSIQVERIEVV